MLTAIGDRGLSRMRAGSDDRPLIHVVVGNLFAFHRRDHGQVDKLHIALWLPKKKDAPLRPNRNVIAMRLDGNPLISCFENSKNHQTFQLLDRLPQNRCVFFHNTRTPSESA